MFIILISTYQKFINTVLLSTCLSQPFGFISHDSFIFVLDICSHKHFSPTSRGATFLFHIQNQPLEHWRQRLGSFFPGFREGLNSHKTTLYLSLKYRSCVRVYLCQKLYWKSVPVCVWWENADFSCIFRPNLSDTSAHQCRKTLHDSLQADVYIHWCLWKNLSFLLRTGHYKKKIKLHSRHPYFAVCLWEPGSFSLQAEHQDGPTAEMRLLSLP